VSSSKHLRFIAVMLLLIAALSMVVSVGAQEATEDAAQEEPVVEIPVETEAPATEEIPTEAPTAEPTAEATEVPTQEPTTEPTAEVTVEPTTEVTAEPTGEVTAEPTVEPTQDPVSAAPTFNLSATTFEAVVGVPLEISLSVSDDLGVVRVTKGEEATLGNVSIVITEPAESAAPFNTGVTVTYLPPADYTGADSFTLTALDSTGESANVTITVNVIAALTEATPEATEIPDTVMAATTYTVNLTSDEADANDFDNLCDVNPVQAGSQCTLRAAIEQANANVDFVDTIRFMLPAGSTVIAPTVDLPAIVDPVIIQGTLGKVVLDGGPNSVDAGLVIGTNGSGSMISGLVVVNFEVVGIAIDESERNTVQGNYIGVLANGLTPAANNVGVFVNAGVDNIIGGNLAASRNIISGNAGGIFMLNTTDSVIQGNYIGTDKTGKVAVPNTDVGIQLVGSFENLIGGATVNEYNIISGNTGDGILLNNSEGNLIAGNNIGVDVTGKVSLGNGSHGINVDAGSPNTRIGGDIAAERNIISGNELFGIFLGSNGNVVQGNFIGTDVTGNLAVPNNTGITIEGNDNTIGGDTPIERNIISGNSNIGVNIQNGATNNAVQGNYIGLKAAGNAALSNSLGIRINMANSNVIGGETAAVRNIISGNWNVGIYVGSSADNLIQNNYIGTDVTGKKAVPNEDDGIFAFNNTSLGVGGVAGRGNTIAFNRGAGVNVVSGRGVLMLSNIIFSNGRIGIDLEDNGVTTNDAGDGDTGANNRQNFPVITAVTSTSIQGTINSNANQPIRIEIFSSATCDASGFGEGMTLLGTRDINTDGAGNATFNLTGITPALKPGTVITTTASNISASDTLFATSEFSRCVTFATVVPSAKAKLIYPVNNGATFTLEPMLEWGAAALADRYTVQIATDKNFANIIEEQFVDGNLYYVPENIIDDGDYYWRIIAGNSIGNGTPGPAFKFTVNTTIGAALTTPINGSHTNDLTPTLSWTRLPGAVTYEIYYDYEEVAACEDFSDPSVEATNKNSYTFPSVLWEGTLYWCVVGYDAEFYESAYSEVFSLNLSLLKAPAKGAVTTDTTPTFSWNKAPGTGVTYTLQVDNNANFSSPEINQAGIVATTFTPTTPLNTDVYFWRLTVNGGTWQQTERIVWTFLVTPARPVAPALITPLTGAVVNDATPRLEWSAVTAVPNAGVQYEIWVSDNARFTNAQILSTGNVLIDTAALVDGKRYYWKVRAVYDGAVYGPFSQTRNFTVDF
jgi:hypothetical protein